VNVNNAGVSFLQTGSEGILEKSARCRQNRPMRFDRLELFRPLRFENMKLTIGEDAFIEKVKEVEAEVENQRVAKLHWKGMEK
jgi:hypothetical protein